MENPDDLIQVGTIDLSKQLIGLNLIEVQFTAQRQPSWGVAFKVTSVIRAGQRRPRLQELSKINQVTDDLTRRAAFN